MEPKDRKRIVINLDQPAVGGGYAPYAGGQARQVPGKSRRWPKVLAIFLVLIFFVVLAAGVGGYFYWRHYQTTPAYSLALIIDAAQRNDMESFQKQIDDDSIAKNLITEVTQKAQDRYGIAMSPALQKQIDTMMPTLVPRLKDTIHEEVAKEIKEFASKSEPKPFIIVALAVPTLMTITTEGDKARATAILPNRTIELGLQRDGDLWKVTELKDEVLLQRIVDSVMKDLPALGSDFGNQLLKGLKRKTK
ncbi:MAG TPA: hypothetical protein VI306_03015 [Pyrinomonadaceae bacterium]